MTCRKTELMFDLQRFAGDDVALVVDVNGDKAPQYFNPNQGANGAYEYAAGSGGAPRVQLYDHLGNPISSTNKLHVQDTELQSRIGALNAAAVTNPASNASVIAALKGLLTLLGPLAGTVEDGAAKVTLSGHNVLHELVWNPTPGSSSWRVFGETDGSSAQAIKPFDASRLAILYVRVINQSGASLSGFGPPYPEGTYGTIGLFYGSLDAQAGVPNPNNLLDVAHGIPYRTPNEGVLTIRLSDCIGADSEDANLFFQRYGAAGVKLSVRAHPDNTGGPITVQFIGGAVS